MSRNIGNGLLWPIGKTMILGLLLTGLLTGCGAATSPSASAVPIATAVTRLVTSDPAPEFGIVVDEHLQVVDVAKGSAAEKAGIQRGDILKTLDNTPLTSTQQAKQLAREAVDSKTLAGQMSTLTVSRKGQEMTLHILPAPPADRGGSPDNPLPTVTPVWPPYDYF